MTTHDTKISYALIALMLVTLSWSADIYPMCFSMVIVGQCVIRDEEFKTYISSWLVVSSIIAIAILLAAMVHQQYGIHVHPVTEQWGVATPSLMAMFCLGWTTRWIISR